MKVSEDIMRILSENPDMEIKAIVDSDVVCDDSQSWWLADVVTVFVDEYYSGRNGVWLKDDDDEYDILMDMEGCAPDGRDIDDLSDSECKELFESLPWKKAIFISVSQ